MIKLQNISLARGGKLLFANVNLTFYKKQKIGVIGRNGSGKTSLFSLITGKLSADSGEIIISNKLTIAEMEQEVPIGAQSCIDFVIDGDSKLRSIEQKIKIAEKQNRDGLEIARLHAEYGEQGGYTASAKAASLLAGLGVIAKDQQKHVNELSGGLRRRLNLARALFINSDVLLLDEPTNHLDLESVIWLENFLKRYAGIILLISHDRDFLDNVATAIVQIENATLSIFSGNYSGYETLKAQQLLLQEKQYEKQQQQIAHVTTFINRFRAKASKAKQAQSRIKFLEKMERVAPVYQSLPFTFEFFPTTAPLNLLALENVDFSYGAQLIFANLNLSIEAGMRVGLLGRNGIGKTTLMKLLVGEIAPQAGERQIHNKTKIGYFAQQQLEQLDLYASPLEHLRRIAPTTHESDLRKFLGRFNFSDEFAITPITNFSGGEKARLALSLVVWQKPNLLLLDEPTNHLDLEMREALALALQTFTGAMIIVSHDRYLLESTVDSFLVISDNNVQIYKGDLADYQKWIAEKTVEKAVTNTSENTAKIIAATSAPAKKSASISKNRLAKIEKELERIDHRLKEIENILTTQDIYLPDKKAQLTNLLAEQKQLQAQNSKLEEEWLVVD